MIAAFRASLAALLMIPLLSQTGNASPGEDAFTNGDYQQAISLLRSELPADTDGSTRLMLGRALMQTNAFKDAYQELGKAVEQRPDDADTQYWYGAAAGSLAANVSLFKAAGYARTTKKAFIRAIELDPKHIEAHQGLVAFYSQAPSIAGGSKKKAISTAQALRTLAPVEGGLLLAGIYSEKQQDKALEILSQVSTSQPNDPRAFLRTGFIYQEDKAYDKAHVAFTNASVAGRDVPDTLDVRLQAFYQIGRNAVFSKSNFEAGISALRQYEAQFIETGGGPPLAWAKYRRGQLHTMADETDAARQAYVDARALTEDKNLLANIKGALR